MKEIEDKIENKKKELQGLQEKLKSADFWQKEKGVAEISRKFAKLKQEIEEIEGSQLEAKPAIIYFQSGAGGRDAEDWTALLFRMYQRFAERKNFQTRILYQRFGEGGGPEGRIGLREAALEIKGKFAYGILKKESGVHRLVRLSPFSAKKLRHTSFAKVEVLPKIATEEQSQIIIKPEDIKVETFRASGPGGQYVNKRESAVRIVHLPTGLKAESQVERFQGMNRKIALEVLAAKLLKLREEEKTAELERIKGEKVSPEFGSQIRSYVLHPYKLAKDHRTGVETSDVEAVLDGDIGQFIEAETRI